MSEAMIWHQEKKLSWIEYYIIVADGETTIPAILKYNDETKEVRVDPYTPPDFDYTVLTDDGVDEDESLEADDDEAERTAFYFALDDLKKFEEQCKKNRVADSLISAKRAQSDG